MAEEECRMVCVSDFEEYAERRLPVSTMNYFRSGADEEITLRENLAAFKRYRLYPRVLVDISERNISTTVLGHRISFPLCISPTALHCLSHSEGELATAQGASDLGIIYTQSTMSTRSLEEVSEAAPDSIRFFQLYIHAEREITRRLVGRVERCGFKALVLTVDVPFMGMRRADARANFQIPPHLRFANFENPEQIGGNTSTSSLRDTSNGRFNQKLNWDDIDWLRSVTPLPIIVKGILRASDAQEACRRGVNGILVSNHGGRQLDSVPATLDVLSEVVEAVAGRCEVYLDGGVRAGTDIFKALALGARAVFIGRPVVFALAYHGRKGLVEMLNILKDEFSSTMAFSGCRNVAEITNEFIRRAEPHHTSSRL